MDDLSLLSTLLVSSLGIEINISRTDKKSLLQLKKQKLDQGNKDGGPVEESDGFVISDRNELMKKLLKKD